MTHRPSQCHGGPGAGHDRRFSNNEVWWMTGRGRHGPFQDQNEESATACAPAQDDGGGNLPHRLPQSALGCPGVTGGAELAGPARANDDRGTTEGILRQNAQTSLKGASAICHRSDGAVFTRSARLLHNRSGAVRSSTYY